MRDRHKKQPVQLNNDDLMTAIEKNTPNSRSLVTNRPDGQQVKVNIPVKIRRIPVAWGFPLDEIIFTKWFVNLMGLPIMPWDPIMTAQSTYLPDARNIIHSNFVNEEKVDWLLMLDSDVCPPPNFLEKLMSHKLPIVGGWYRKKGGENPPVVYDYHGIGEDGKMQWQVRQTPGKGLEKVDGAGAGCWLLHRKVAEAVGEKPYDMLRGGEDLDFCMKVKKAGFDIYVDWDIACAHAGVSFV